MLEMHVYQYINRYLYDKLKIKDGPKHIKDGLSMFLFLSQHCKNISNKDF